ncbi:MAG: glycosyltransferase [Halorientalis sp.]
MDGDTCEGGTEQGDGDAESVSVLWLTPDKPENISVGRERIARHLRAAGHDVRLRGTTARTIARSLTERGQYDVVLGTTRLGAIAGVGIARAHGIPLCVDHIDPIRQFRETNGSWLATVVERLENVAFRDAAHVLYVYPEETARIEPRAAATTKTDLGVDVSRFADPDPAVVERVRDRVRARVETDNIAVYVGGLEPIYSIEPLLASAQHLDDWTLLLVGAGSLEPSVEAAAEEHENVVYPGMVPHEDVPGYLHTADVGVSLVDDPHTLKVLEYGAAGLPVVQATGRAESRFGGLVEYCRTEPEEIAAAIERAGDSDSGGCLSEYVTGFDWGAIAADYCQAITTVKY